MSVRHHNALEPGYRLHWYRVESVLGQGGFGITYLATDTNLDQPVAIKEFLPSDLAVRTRDSEVHPVSEARRDTFGWGLTRFLTEARTLAQFRHPNIVRVYSVFETNGTAYMVMEYERGTSLEDALKFRYVEGERALLSLVHALMDGLELVHRAGFIHRDIKPDNVYLREGDGVPVLLDFGSARQAVGVETRTLTSLVTPGYAPFEQYNATRENDRQGPWTDVYSLAATLYRAITGRGPIDAVARADALLSGDPDPLIPLVRMEPAGYSQRLLEAVDRGLMFQPGDRPQTLAEWRELLPARPTMPDFTAAAARTVRAATGPGSDDETVVRGEPAAAPRTAGAPPSEPTVGAAGPPPPQPAVGGAGRDAPPRRRAAVTASALLLAAAGAAAWWFLGPAPAPAPGPAPPAAKREAPPPPATPGSAPSPPAAVATAEPAARAADTAPVPRSGTSTATDGAARDDAAAARLAADRERLERDRAALEAQRARFELEAERRAAEDARRAAEEQARRMARERARLEEERGRLEAQRAEQDARAAAVRAAEDAAADAARAADAAGAGTQPAAGQPATQAAVQAGAAPAQTAVAATPAPAPPAPAPAGEPAQLRELLERADDDVAALRLTSPPGDNAVERYRAALAQDPGNARALDGLSRVVARYLDLVGSALDAGDPERAGVMLERARGVDPQHPGLAAAADALENARLELQARAAQAAQRERVEQERLQAEREAAARRAEVERTRAERVRAERDRIAAEREQARREALAREQAAAERAKAEADATARAAAAAARTVRIGVFPHDSIRTCFFTVGSRIDEGARAAALARPEVSVVYSYYTRGADTSQVGTGSRLWEGTAARKTPVVGAVQAAARAMDVDAVLMGWYHCHHSQGIAEDRYRVELYLVDVRTGQTYMAERGLLATRSAVDEVLGKLYAARGL